MLYVFLSIINYNFDNDDEFIDFEFLDKEKQAEQVRLYDETEEGEDGDDDRKEDEDEEGENESEPAANLTRWSSTYLVLESVKRAYDRGAFNEIKGLCPVPLETVEIYLQIMKPAYDLSINLQYNDSTICDTLPSIYDLICTYETMIVGSEEKEFLELLVENIKLHFSYEMNSLIYKVKFCLKINHFLNYIKLLYKGCSNLKNFNYQILDK